MKMESWCGGILAGSLVALLLPAIPHWYWPMSLFLVCTLLRSWFAAGVCLYLSSLSLQLYDYSTTSQQVLAQHSTIVAGTVVSIPQHYDGGSRFILQLSETVKDKAQLGAGSLLLVRWHQAPVKLQQGQRWQLPVKLKPIRGLANPGGGWAEAQALVSQWVAQATVISSLENFQVNTQLRAHSWQMPQVRQTNAIARQHTVAGHDVQFLGVEPSLRQQLFEQLDVQLSGFGGKSLMLALTLGERPFSDELWLGLQATGLGHLISISGMHIALVFGWVVLSQGCLGWLARNWLWRYSLVLVAALLAAWLYSALAGYAVPTVRALLALLLLVVLKLFWRRTSGRQFSLLVAALLLILRPFWLLSLSFWLSVLAVALVFYLGWRYPAMPGKRAALLAFLRYQLIFSVLMLPVGLLFFQGIAPLSLLSNLLFVPWCSLLVIPLLLLVFLLQSLSSWPLIALWQLVDIVLQPLVWWLEFAAQANWWWSVPQAGLLLTLLLLAGLLLLLTPRTSRQLPLVVLLCLPLLLVFQSDNSSKMHVIDVGQGTAILLQQGRHGLLYDFGPRYGSYSATAAAVLPYLRYQGIRQLDYLLLSHNDSDHSGHLALLRRAYPTARLVSDVKAVQPELNCRQLPAVWQQFALQVLWPAGPVAKDVKNDQSCVLWLEIHGWKVLVTGDISSATEQQLMALTPKLSADVLVLAHHGSKSSNQLSFLQQLKPQLTVNSAGFANAYQHPADEVRARLALLQIPLYNTADSGALQLHFNPAHAELQAVRPARLVKWLENLPVSAETGSTTR